MKSIEFGNHFGFIIIRLNSMGSLFWLNASVKKVRILLIEYSSTRLPVLYNLFFINGSYMATITGQSKWASDIDPKLDNGLIRSNMVI